MTLPDKLAKIGLKDNEAKVYVAALELGEALVGQIEKQTGLHKQLIYNAAASLQEKELLSIVEIRGRKRFVVTNAAALEERARVRLEETQNIMPELLKIANKKKIIDKIRAVRGVHGIHQYYLERIRKQPPESRIFILGVNSQRYFKLLPTDSIAFHRFESVRIEKKITSQLLLFGNHEQEANLNVGRKYIDMRLLTEAVQAPMDIMIWETSVGMLFYGDEPYVLDIAGKDTVDGFSDYFRVLWNAAQNDIT